MFAKLLRGPSADTLTLEVIGLVKSRKNLKNGEAAMDSRRSAELYARRIDRLLRDNRKTMDPEVRTFLTEASRHLAQLGQMESTMIYTTDRGVLGYRLGTKPHPRWNNRYQQFQTELDTRATQLFDDRYLADAQQLHDQTAPDRRARLEKQNLGMKLARQMGRL